MSLAKSSSDNCVKIRSDFFSEVYQESSISPLTLKFRNDCNFPAFSDLESSVPYNQPNFDVIGNVATSRWPRILNRI